MDRFYRPCEFSNIQKLSELYDFQKDGYIIMDFQLDDCQPDGWYSPVRETDNDRYCSDPRGDIIENYIVSKTDPKAKDMNCSKCDLI